VSSFPEPPHPRVLAPRGTLGELCGRMSPPSVSVGNGSNWGVELRGRMSLPCKHGCVPACSPAAGQGVCSSLSRLTPACLRAASPLVLLLTHLPSPRARSPLREASLARACPRRAAPRLSGSRVLTSPPLRKRSARARKVLKAPVTPFSPCALSPLSQGRVRARWRIPPWDACLSAAVACSFSRALHALRGTLRFALTGHSHSERWERLQLRCCCPLWVASLAV